MKQIIISLTVVLICCSTNAQNISGTWQGNLNIQANEIPVIFHIVKDSAGKLTASFDSPVQKAYNLPCSEVIAKGDSVIFMMPILKGKFAGLLSEDKNQITGSWYQGAGSLPLTLNKTSNAIILKEIKRPQTPRPPYPYNSEDVEYFNADKSIHFGATITYPKTESTIRYIKVPVYPAVILITGSGQQDRDETIFDHKSFAVIADYLTKKGFAVLRVDDRGTGKTSGSFSASTTADFVKDVQAGIDFLKTRPETDKQKIGLIGHSEGGMIAPVVAASRNEIKYIVLLAGPGIPIVDLMTEQVEAVSASSGDSPAKVKAISSLFRQIAIEVNKTKDSATLHKNALMIVDTWAKSIDTAVLSALGLTDRISREKYTTTQLAAVTSSWYKYFLAFNPQLYLQKLTCKVLALNGEKDIQVIARSNLAGIKKSLQKSKSPQYDVMEIPGVNHLFQTCIKCTADEYGELEESFSPKALEIMGNWLNKNVK